MSFKRKSLLSFCITLAIIFIDQGTKLLISKTLPLNFSKKIIGDFLCFTYIKNPKGAFGIPLPNWFPFEIVAMIAIFLLLFVIFQEKKTIYIFFYSFLLGGAFGNIIDRLREKAVTDFIDIGITPRIRWPIFNVADAVLTTGIIALLLLPFYEKYIQKKLKTGEKNFSLDNSS